MKIRTKIVLLHIIYLSSCPIIIARYIYIILFKYIHIRNKTLYFSYQANKDYCNKYIYIYIYI